MIVLAYKPLGKDVRHFFFEKLYIYNENFKTTIPSNNYDRSKQLENVECFKYLGSVLTNDGRCTCEIKSRIAMAKAAFSKKKTLFASKIGLKFEEETNKMLHLEHGFVWC